MSSQPPATPAFDTLALAGLACPACYGDLRIDGARIFCAACQRAYPIIDGIPVFVAENAAHPAQES